METCEQAASHIPKADRLGSFDLPFAAKLSGMLLVGASLFAIAQTSRADTVQQDSPASPAACQRMRQGLIEAAHGSANKVVMSKPSSNLSTATIFVSDGQIRITCDEVANRMSITRVVDSRDSDHASDEVAPIEAVGLLAQR